MTSGRAQASGSANVPPDWTGYITGVSWNGRED